MSFPQAISQVFKNYANFNGRARRSEYWWFLLFSIMIEGLIWILAVIFGGRTIYGTLNALSFVLIASGVYALVTFLPSLAVFCRRLHDIGKPGTYILFGLLPVVGEILLLVWAFQDGQPWTNQYGPDPKNRGLASFSPAYSSWGTSPMISERMSFTPSTQSFPPSGKTCQHCGASVKREAVFCGNCGKDLRDFSGEDTGKAFSDFPSKKVCSYCGNPVAPNYIFCDSCGKRIINSNASIGIRDYGFTALTDMDID